VAFQHPHGPLRAGQHRDRAQGQRSAYVQAHGTLRSGAATAVVNTQHCGKYSCSYTSAIAVTVSPPVDGVGATVAHYNGSAPVFAGERLQVLVDPKLPTYAELPGSPFKGAHTWVGSILIALFCAVIATFWIREIRVQRRRGAARAGRAQPAT
jgi:hypothetical protein